MGGDKSPRVTRGCEGRWRGRAQLGGVALYQSCEPFLSALPELSVAKKMWETKQPLYI